jgi:hypothetical protein
MNLLFFKRALAFVARHTRHARGAGLALLLASFAACFASPAWATDVGVSVRISQPGVYGRVDIGRFPQPQVWVPQPVWGVQPVQVVQAPPPVYLWVPTGHRKHWRKHCSRYGACAHPVYFVRDDWYGQHVRPHHPGHAVHSQQTDWHRDGYRDGYQDRHHWDAQRGKHHRDGHRYGHRDKHHDKHRDGGHDGRHDRRGDKHHH